MLPCIFTVITYHLGALTEQPCKPGEYQPSRGQSECIACPNGTMCPESNTTSLSTCELGYYCPAGLPIPCPAGTYGGSVGLKTVSQCSNCTAGKYCPGLANTAPSSLCAAGWYCEGGANNPTPSPSSHFPRNGPCKKGKYSRFLEKYAVMPVYTSNRQFA